MRTYEESGPTLPADWCYFSSEEGEQGGKYGPETQGLSQSSPCQADFTLDVP